MPYIYHAVMNLEGSDKIGNGSCPLLVQHYAAVPKHDRWRQGGRVVEQQAIWPGVAIATFENGVYPNEDTGNHVAFFVKFGKRRPDGSIASIWVMEQFKSSRAVGMREIHSKGQVDSKWGKRWADPSNNADAFYIIE